MDLKLDDAALDDGQFTRQLSPRGAVGEFGVQPGPGAGPRGAIATGLGEGGDLGRGLGSEFRQRELGAVLGRATGFAVLRGAGKEKTRSERSRPSNSTGRSASRNARRVTS